MEYLMTYGWAILIIAVVLGALYSLGIFNGSNFLGGSCIAAPGYLCTNPLLSTDGKLSFTYGYQGPNVTVVGFACTNTTTAPSSFASSGSSSLEPGQEESVSTSCTLSSSATVGTSFSGYLWVEYDQSGQSDLIARFAMISTSVNVESGTYLAFISDYDGGVVSVISSSNYAIVANIPMNHPSWITLTSDDNYAYVESWSGVEVVDTHTYNIVDTIPLSGNPSQIVISPDGDYLYVDMNQVAGSVNVISTSSKSLVGTIGPLNSPYYMAISHGGSTLFVSSVSQGYTKSVALSGDSGTISNSFSIAPFCMTLSPNDIVVYGCGSSTLSYYSSSTGAFLSDAPSGSTPRALILSSDGSTAYVADYLSSGTVSIVNIATKSVIATLNAGSYPMSLALTPDEKYLYVASSGGGSGAMTVIRLSDDTVVKNIPFGSNPEFTYIAVT
jgi:YVTN family beta-propeller protein